ncbi:uncharacterized protein LOC110748791 [Prunus avium]|uniref:Uncharacterized protein LOC110748791 n=1 Tax=Prunus avium TaxID=42229 RepID=A0A6P5RHV6_PRUAV|nr:uncharacterized protein LOC110748791 [Prunus avium]
MHDICNYDAYFVQKCDSAGVFGLLPKQKLTAVIRMLAYGASADQVDEIAWMGKSITLEALVRFCDAVETLYTRDYLRRPTPRDLQRVQQKAKSRGFPGMIVSIDYMHWQWKNCPTAWQGDYENRKGQKCIILEAVASFDTWVWHAFFGVAGSQNDLNVLGPGLQRCFERPRPQYHLSSQQYNPRSKDYLLPIKKNTGKMSKGVLASFKLGG